MINHSRLFHRLPGFVFYKTLGSSYLACNYHMSELVGLQHPEAIEGLTDADIFKDELLVQRYLQDDAAVVQEGSLTVLEPTQNKNGESLCVLTTKNLFLNERNEPLGIAVQAIIVPELSSQAINARKKIVSSYKNLTRKESEVIYYLARCYSYKDIAKVCNRSPRTIEKHIENIKLKLKVSSKKAIVDYWMQNHSDTILSRQFNDIEG